ncbi:Pentatricopeptide repeat [Macleaya cordata]|uniref:Pentatricopeptide repeat n=1 Tax=Macleaya cordata TaxID=56857 RepID=A0A200QRW5_MACCD|nr:Pentatricopeptide repeat [Macleaya cordata]
MMLPGCSSGELGHDNFHNSVQNPISFPCKLQTLHSLRDSLVFPRDNKARVFLGFRLHDHNRRELHVNSLHSVPPDSENKDNFSKSLIPYAGNQSPRSGNKVIELKCHATTVLPPRRTFNNNGKKQKYGGSLPSILHALETEDDMEKTLNSWVGKLSPKEQTVILKEQRNWGRVLSVFRWMKSQKDYIPNVIHYNVVLRVLGRAQKWDELRLCWIDMARDGIFPTNNTYGMLIDVYAKAGLVNEALLWLKHMRQRSVFPDEVTMTTVVRVLKEAGEFDRADKLFKDWCVGRVELDDLDMETTDDSRSGLGLFSPKHFLSTELFKAGGRIPPSKIVSPTDMENSIHKPRLAATYNTLIDMYGKAGRLKDASYAFAEMLKSGVAPDTFTFNTMIFTCGTHGHLLEAETLLSKMEERGIRPDTKTYNIFLSLYAKTGNVDASLVWYRKIREVGLFPDKVTHRAILRILCEENRVSEVEAVIEEMEKFSIHIDQHSLPVVIRMYIGERLLDKTKILLEKCQLDGGISSKTYAAIIDAYADNGLSTDAEAVFYRKRDLVADKKDVVEYNVMIKAYGKSKLYDKALSLFKSMRSNGTWPDECTYNSLIQMLSGGDLVDPARDLLVEMQEAGFKPRCATFSAVIASNTRLGRVSDAVDVYGEMTKAGVEPNEVVFGSLINGFAEAGRLEEALHYFRTMEKFGISANQIVLTSLIKAYGKVGSLEGAKELYRKMKDVEGGPDIVASNSMINLYAELGMVSEAKLIFDKLRENGRADGVTFATMMYLYKNMGMLDEAIDVAQEMQDSGLLRDCASFNTVMASYATNGQLRECGELLNQMVTRKILPDFGTFKVMLTVLKKGGFPSEAVTQLESCYREGKPYARQAIITSVFSVLGLHAYALESCDVLTKAEVGLDSHAYNVAIYAYGSFGEVNKALNIFMKMQDEELEPDLVTYINLVGCYGKAGMVEGVKRIHSQLKYGEIEPNESLFEAVIDAYRNVNRRDLAELVTQEMKFAFDAQEQTGSENEEYPEDLSMPFDPEDP